MSQEEYDVVIVGAGAAGCVVASYLAEHTDASIALIEAGDMDRDPFIHIPAGFAKMLANGRHVWNYETVPQHGRKRIYPSGKVFGGGSSVNAMCYVRGHMRDYAAWQAAVGDTGKWSYVDLLPVFKAQEHNDTFHDEFHGIDGGLAVQLPKGTTMFHPVGTCRMGQDARAVVDARLRVRGIDRLRVIDASIMPNITSGNTNAPTQALARHATAMLVEDLNRT